MERQKIALAKKNVRKMKNEKPIILGSGSPRRREILSLFHLDFTVDSADIDESDISEDLTPEEYTKVLAKRKGDVLIKRHPHCMIISADTIVYHQGKYLGKPKNKEEAFFMLKSLSGKTHLVGSSIAITTEDKQIAAYQETFVTLRELDSEKIHKYIDIFNPLDKAGSYGAQDGGGILIQKIEGNFHNVVGFEVKLLEKLFIKFGVDLWQLLAKKPLSF